MCSTGSFRATRTSATGWEHYPHGADIGVRGYGRCKEEAFVQAARSLIAVITDPAGVGTRERVEFRCEAPDEELLFAEKAPEAYKDVSAVVDAADAAGLARKVARLEPLVCIKG